VKKTLFRLQKAVFTCKKTTSYLFFSIFNLF